MSTTIAILATFLLAPVLLAPLVAYYAFRVAAQPSHAPADPDNPFVPPAFTEHLDRTQRRLYAEGFNLVGSAWTSAAFPVERFVAVFENPAQATVALAILRVAAGRSADHAPSASVHFITDLVDGFRLRTDNDPTMGGCPGEDAGRLQVPAIADPRRLFRAHRARVEYAGLPAPRAGRIDSPADEYANAAYVRGLYEQLEYRRLQLDEENLELRPTIRGAILMGLRHLGPTGLLRRAWHYYLALAYLAVARESVAPVVPQSQEAESTAAQAA